MVPVSVEVVLVHALNLIPLLLEFNNDTEVQTSEMKAK